MWRRWGAVALVVLAAAGVRPGDAAECPNVNPCIEELTWAPNTCIADGPLAGYCYQDFYVISFGGFCAYRGDIEGRLLVRGDVFIAPDGFSLGMELRTRAEDCEDARRPYALVLGGDTLCWSHGTLFPDGSGSPFPSPAEGIFAAPELEVSDCLPMHIVERQTGQCPSAQQTVCLEETIDQVQQYYEQLVDGWCGSDVRNTRWIHHYGGLFIKALTNDTNLFVRVPKQVLNEITYYDLKNVAEHQNLIFLVSEDTGDCSATQFGQGAPVPLAAERVAFAFCERSVPDCLMMPFFF